MKLTPLGKFLRTYRIKKEIYLKDMSETLGISLAYLSAIEFGKRPIPKDFKERLVSKYKFSNEELVELNTAVTATLDTIKIISEDIHVKDIALALARTENLTEAQKNKIMEVLDGKARK